MYQLKKERIPLCVLFLDQLLKHGVPSAYEEFVSIRNRFKNFAVILYI
nr:hypothetical protein [Enterococcus faecium]